MGYLVTDKPKERKMDLGLTGKTALVTAATQGLGFATARQLAAEGVKVMICGRDAGKLAHALQQLQTDFPPTPIQGMVADVSKPEDVSRLVSETVATLGKLDILITNAGGPPSGSFATLDLEAWDRAIQLTLMSVVRLIKAALPHLQQSRGTILTITSISAKQPIAGLLFSNVLRPAVVGLTKTLSQELAADGIRVNSVLPGWTTTERVHELLSYRAGTNQTTLAEEAHKIAPNIPLGRMAEPSEFGRVATFLVSPAASYLTGVMLPIDGGSYAGLL